MNSAAPLDLPHAASFAMLERVRRRARRHVLWMRHLWAQGFTSADQGLAIGHGEVDRQLRDPRDLAAERERFFAEDPQALAMESDIAAGDHAATHDREWLSLCGCFALNAADSDLLALAVAAERDPGLARVYGYLHDDVQACHATPWLAAQLFDWPDDWSCGPDSSLMTWRLALPAETARNPWSVRAPWLADPAVALSLQHQAWREPRVEAGVTLMRSAPPVQCLHPEALTRMRAFILATQGTVREIEIVGPAGSGKRTLAAQLLSEGEHSLLVADAALLFADKPPEIAADCVLRVLRMARAFGSVVFWRNADVLPPAAWRAARNLYDIVLFDRQAPCAEPPPDRTLRDTVRLAAPSAAQRLQLWQTLSEAPPPAAIRERPLFAGEIAAAAAALPRGGEALQQALRPSAQPPSDLLQPLVCPYDWSDMVLPPDTRRQLEEFEQQARLRWPVYEDWGFERLVPMGKGISVLFAGQSGTGKTMAAQVIARALQLDLWRVDLAGVVNKYIGETEKRLKQVFDYCERANVMLFFDEADALFGQRMQVKDAHDRFANVEINYLLQRMEQFNGIAVLATNRKNDLDKAFLRRLRFIVDFLPPGPEERLGLWRRALLPHAPSGEELLGDIDWALLAERLTMTGADIKSAALGAAFLARAEGGRIAMRHVVAASRREMTKHGVVLRTSLGEEA